MKKFIGIFVYFMAVILFVVFIGSLCINYINDTDKESAIISMTEATALSLLPPDTSIVEDLGNGWFKIDMKGKYYIYRFRKFTNGSTTEILTPIPTVEKEN